MNDSPVERRKGPHPSPLPRGEGDRNGEWGLLGREDGFASDDAGGFHFLEVSGAQAEVV